MRDETNEREPEDAALQRVLPTPPSLRSAEPKRDAERARASTARSPGASG